MLRHILYARKSHEDDSRQSKSVGDQVETMVALAEREGRNLLLTLTEDKSAREPYQRPVFDEMVRLLQAGEADAILCYHVNRLARNMVEGGLLQHLLTKRILKEIRTQNEVFRSGDNILPFILQTAMSAQYSLDLSSIVRDRVGAKVARGEYPQRAPEGYRNNPFRHTIEKDPERFPLVQKAWELMATGTYSLERLARVMNEEWGYRTRPAFKVGGVPIQKSGLHRLFHNVFYTGHFLYRGELHQGVHEPMVSWETYEAVQRVLGRKGATRARKRRDEFAFSGLLLCGACGRRVTAEHKTGRHGTGDYTYYHCANYQACRQKGVRREVVEDEVARTLASVALSPQMRPLCVEVIERAYREEANGQAAELSQQHRTLEDAQRRMSRLVQMGIRGLLTDEEFGREKAALAGEIGQLQKAAGATNGRLEHAREGALEVAEFVTRAASRFAAGDALTRREIARALGAVFRLEDGKVRLELHPLLVPLLRSEGHEAARNPSPAAAAIEPLKTGSGSRKADPSESAVPLGWEEGTLLEAFRQVIRMLLEGIPPLKYGQPR